MANKVKGRSQTVKPIEQEAGEVDEQQGGILALIEENQRMLLMVAGIVLLLVGGWFGYQYLQNSKDAEAQEEMIAAVRYFEADSLDKALNGDGSFLGFIDIADEYGGTSAGNMAKYYTGIIYHRQGDYATSVDYLNEVSGKDALLGMARYQALGYAYEGLEEWENAAESFEKAATTPEEGPLSPALLIKAGENYEDAGDLDKALKVYTQVKEDFPNSAEARNIEKYIARVAN
ncbi:MAG: tetratricopeptide repeat protein [Bacteroidota bacterium]